MIDQMVNKTQPQGAQKETQRTQRTQRSVFLCALRGNVAVFAVTFTRFSSRLYFRWGKLPEG
jgi:hypothetical protein